MCIKTRGDLSWPRAKEASQREAVDVVVSALLSDFEHLLSRGETLAHWSTEGIDLIVNAAVLQQSRKAKTKAEAMERMIVLAIFFLPLSFTASFCGMNCIEFGTGKQSIWLSFVVLISVVAI